MTEPPRRDANRRPPYGGNAGAAGARERDTDPRGPAHSWAALPTDAYGRRRPASDASSEQPDRRAGQPSSARAGQPRNPPPSDGRPRGSSQPDEYGRKPSPGRGTRPWGTLPGRVGVCLVIASAAVGALLTALARSEPGLVLGLCVVAGTFAAALAVHSRAVYRIIPVPALSYLVAAVLAGMIHDRANGTSSTALAVGATQWIAGGFVAMTAATLLAIAITAARFRARGRAPQYRAPAGRRLPRDETRGS